jgi:poly-gamma-glutamate capsule biosynthesis protein CapA/YwtB (metallophosphatase superfamily)
MLVAMAMASMSACTRAPRAEKTAVLWLGGDVNLGDGGKGQLQGITGMVQGEAGIVNLEGPVAQLRPESGSVKLWNSPQALSELAALSVRVAGIANNHAGDAGEGGSQASASQLRARGISPAGGVAGFALLNIGGITIAVTAHDLTGGVPQGLAEDLATARRQSQVLVSTFHVTGPASYLPRTELRQAVEIAYHAGANVIAAHGTHAIGPVERSSHAVIAWGLGNVAFACDCTQEEDALLLRVTVQPDRVLKAEVLPIQAGLNHQPALPAKDAGGIFDLLEAIRSSKLERSGGKAYF